MIIEQDDEAYHAAEGVSKSGLWTLHTKTPFHYRFGERTQSDALDIGKATHIAILEPDTLEFRVSKGPADRRGNKWKEFLDFCEFNKTIPLIEDQYEQAMRIRDLSAGVEQLRIMRSGETIVEHAGYHVDEKTGMLVKCKPDMYSKTHRIICDIKTAADASKTAFEKSCAKFGYHVQEPMYTDVWSKASAMEVEAFFFVVFEKSKPPMVAVYELDAAAVREGHMVYRQALERYAACFEADDWPGYSEDVQQITLPKWGFNFTNPGDEE